MPTSVEFARSFRRNGAPVAHLVAETGEAYTLQFTPETAQLSGFGWKIGTADRQGRKPLSRRDAQQLMTLSFTHLIKDEFFSIGVGMNGERVVFGVDKGSSANWMVRDLIGLADSGKKVRLINVSSDIETRGWWYPQLSVSITQRKEFSQDVRLAELSWTLTEAVDERPAIAKTPPPPPPPKPAATSAGGQQDYTVVRGDSLWRIAAKFLGKGERWREIYDLNKDRLQLKPPEMYRGLLTVWIYPGQVMKIPAR